MIETTTTLSDEHANSPSVAVIPDNVIDPDGWVLRRICSLQRELADLKGRRESAKHD